METPNPKTPPREKLPSHVAIIMDGNGRWATTRGLPRLDGHRRGADVVREITTFSRELGLDQLTLYSFSVQNWQRPPEEVAGLMQLLEEYCRDERDTLMDNEIRLDTIGTLARLPSSTREAVEKLKGETAKNDHMTLTLAIDYGSREEVSAAVQKIAASVASGALSPNEIDESTITSHLHTANMPDPDLVIRTSGELRISNFLLWQIAYAELYFTDTLWPDFTRTDYASALSSFAGRNRRFGATQEQLSSGDIDPALPSSGGS